MSISRWFCAAFAAALLCAPVALTKGNANIDEDLAAFIETFSECGRRYRLYEHDPEVLKDELSQLDFPDNWSAMVESLVVRYDGDLQVWLSTFAQIESRSRR